MHIDLHLLAETQDDSGKWSPANSLGSLYPGQEFDRQEFVPWWRGYDPAVIALMTGIQIQGLTAIGITPITPPRGLPDDLSDEFKEAQVSRGVLGGHTFSWISAADLLGYQWSPLVTIKRRITAGQWQAMTADRRRQIIEDSLRLPNGSVDWIFANEAITAIEVSFRSPVQTLVESFLGAVIPHVAALIGEVGGDQSRVRLVFGLSS